MPTEGQNLQSALLYLLFAVFDEGVGEASLLDLLEHNVGIRFDRVIRMVHPGGMNHNSLRRYGSTRLVAGVIRQNEFAQNYL